MKVDIKNIKTVTKLGARGLVLFLTKEIRYLKWTDKTKLNIIVFEDEGKKGILIEKA
ncbi:MAG: hypothetical protein KJ906_02540 [Nanoarchaeota archaeon]|nr:hypothetical protein [Nanoarchaeota archaeon]